MKSYSTPFVVIGDNQFSWPNNNFILLPVVIIVVVAFLVAFSIKETSKWFCFEVKKVVHQILDEILYDPSD